MAVQRKLSILLVKLYANGDRDTIYFRTRAKDVIVDEAKGTTLDTVVKKVEDIKDGATKTEKSLTNGNIKIDGTEVAVYRHPESSVSPDTYNSVTVDANGHVTAGTKVTDWKGSVSGEVSEGVVKYQPASARSNIATGEKLSVIAGKIHKWFADLKSMAFVDKVGTTNLDTTLSTFYNKRITKDNVTTSTAITQEGWVADARAIASLKNEINTLNSKIRERIKVQPYFLSKWENIYIQISSDINNRTKCVEFNLPADGSTYLINYGISFKSSNNDSMFKAYITFDITENRQTWCGNDIVSDGYGMRVDLFTVIIVNNEAEGRCSINACAYTHIPVYAYTYLIRVTRLYYDWS